MRSCSHHDERGQREGRERARPHFEANGVASDRNLDVVREIGQRDTSGALAIRDQLEECARGLGIEYVDRHEAVALHSAGHGPQIDTLSLIGYDSATAATAMADNARLGGLPVVSERGIEEIGSAGDAARWTLSPNIWAAATTDAPTALGAPPGSTAVVSPPARRFTVRIEVEAADTDTARASVRSTLVEKHPAVYTATFRRSTAALPGSSAFDQKRDSYGR